MAFSASFLRSCSLLISRQIPTDSTPLLFSTTHGFAARIAAASSTSKTDKSKSAAATGGAKKKKQTTTTATKAKASTKEPTKPMRPRSALNYYMKDHLGKRADGAKVTDNFTAAAEAFKRLKPAELQKYQMLAAEDQDRYAKEQGIKVKRPLSAYNVYVKENMPHRPQDKKVTEYMSVLAADFRNLSTNDRAKYEQASKADYDRAKVAKENLPQKDEPTKRPLNSYNMFVQEHMLNRKDGVVPKEVMKELGPQWRGLTKAQRKKYDDMAAREKEAWVAANPDSAKDKASGTKAASQ